MKRSSRIKNWLARTLHSEDGTVAVEFVLAVPILMAIFTAAFESGLIMTRAVILEQALDETMRELRLGHYPIPSHHLLKAEICSRTTIFPDCANSIMIELQRVDTSSWTLPSSAVACVDRAEDIQPVTVLQVGQQNDIMMVRVCLVQDLLFPSIGIGQRLPQDGQGGFGIIALSAFVNEPT